MAQTIKLKRSATQNAVPSTSSLALGELAINTYDGKLFIKKNVSGTESIVTIGEVGANSIGPTELASTAVTAGSYGSTSAIPVITIDEDGRITSASTATISGLSANSVTSTEIAANAVGISELNVSDGTDGQVLTTDGNGNLAFEDQSGGAASATAFSTNIASGDGTTTAFTLSESPSAESKIIAFINGVFQNQDAYTISGTTLTFDTAPISGTNNVVVYVIGDVYSGESVLISNFSGNGTTTAFTLANNPGNENNTQVYIDGVYQQKTTYSVSGTTLTFSSAPPTGTNNIEVVMLTSTTVNTPAAGSVVTASMADDSVTASKIVSSAVTTAKIADSNVTTAKIADSNVTTAKIADSNVTTAKIADDAVTIGKIADAALVIESEGISSNDNDTTLPTSAAVKDYVDTQVAGKDALSELSGDTDDVSEGSTNLYYTDARADARIAAATTDDLTEGSTNLYYTDARVGTYISGNRTFGNITTTGYIAGPSTFTIDPAAVGDNTGTLVIAGNLQVDGTTTTVNSTTLTVDDKLVTLGSGSVNAGAANGAGIEVDISGVTNPSLTYDGTNDEWDFNKDINVTGTVTADGLSVDSGAITIATSGTNTLTSTGTLRFDIDSDNNATDNRYHFTKNAGAGTVLEAREDGDVKFFDASGTNAKFYWDASAERLGIGTTSPSFPLHSVNASTSYVMAETTGTGTSAGFRMKGDASADFTLFTTQGTNQFAIYDNANTAQRLTLDSSGKVGIGTSSPSSYQANADDLVVATSGHTGITIASGTTHLGNIHFADGTTGDDAYRGFIQYEHIANYMRFATNAAEAMRIDSSGDVLIGSSTNLNVLSGTPKIQVGDGSGHASIQWYSGTGSVAGLYFGDASSGSARYEGYIEYRHNTNSMAFRTEGDDRVIIDSSGQVKIGNTSGSGILNVDNGANDGGYVHFANNVGSTTLTNDKGLAFGWNKSNAGGESIIIANQGPGSTGGLVFATNTSGGSYAERMRINSAGNVGINNTECSHKLHVEENGTGAITSLRLANENTSVGDGSQILFTSGTSTVGAAIAGYGTALNKAALIFKAGGDTERMRIDSSGNVGIAHTSPKSKLSIVGDGSLNTYSGTIGIENTANDKWASITLTDDIDTASASSNYYLIGRGSTYANRYMSFHVPTASNYGSGSEPKFVFASTGADILYTVEASTGDAYHKGNVGIGDDNSDAKLSVIASSVSGGIVKIRDTDGTVGLGNTILGLYFSNDDDCSTATFLGMYDSGSRIGSITVTNATSTSFNTTSDYRLKENVTYDFNALDRVAQLKPARFNWIKDKTNSTVDGFLAHEVSDVVPEAIHGEKDAMMDEEYEVTPAVLDDDGNIVTEAEMGIRQVPDYQGIDHSKLVPLLTKAIQELKTELDAAKARLDEAGL